MSQPPQHTTARPRRQGTPSDKHRKKRSSQLECKYFKTDRASGTGTAPPHATHLVVRQPFLRHLALQVLSSLLYPVQLCNLDFTGILALHESRRCNTVSITFDFLLVARCIDLGRKTTPFCGISSLFLSFPPRCTAFPSLRSGYAAVICGRRECRPATCRGGNA